MHATERTEVQVKHLLSWNYLVTNVNTTGGIYGTILEGE